MTSMQTSQLHHTTSPFKLSEEVQNYSCHRDSGDSQDIFGFDLIHELPVDQSLSIFRFLDVLDLCKSALVSREWRHFSNDDSLWEQACRSRWEGKVNARELLIDYQFIPHSILDLHQGSLRSNDTRDRLIIDRTSATKMCEDANIPLFTEFPKPEYVNTATASSSQNNNSSISTSPSTSPSSSCASSSFASSSSASSSSPSPPPPPASSSVYRSWKKRYIEAEIDSIRNFISIHELTHHKWGFRFKSELFAFESQVLYPKFSPDFVFAHIGWDIRMDWRIIDMPRDNSFPSSPSSTTRSSSSSSSSPSSHFPESSSSTLMSLEESRPCADENGLVRFPYGYPFSSRSPLAVENEKWLRQLQVNTYPNLTVTRVPEDWSFELSNQYVIFRTIHPSAQEYELASQTQEGALEDERALRQRLAETTELGAIRRRRIIEPNQIDDNHEHEHDNDGEMAEMEMADFDD